jgi:GH15 family glucan-1,4-alpha-glucosidase
VIAMAVRIEDYAAVGNCEAMALIGRDGSIDWLGCPRVDSAAFFSALLGNPENGRWLLAPASRRARARRSYRGNTMILETTFEVDAGEVILIDFMARREGVSELVRIVRGVRGKVSMQTELVVRFGYGRNIPWVQRMKTGRREFIAGPDRLLLDSEVGLRGENLRTVGQFEIAAGEQAAFVLSWTPSYCPEPPPRSAVEALEETEAFWTGWSNRFKPRRQWSDAILRSLLTLKALTHRQTGGIAAAGTTSLPERIGGWRNWDYRYCWLRDATFTLYALLTSGYVDEARAWREWLLRAVAGSPEDLQIMYGIAGERRLDEFEVPWLPGYRNSKPVRIGNAAAEQLQLDVYGEVLDALYVARKAGLQSDRASWSLERALLTHLESVWRQPDNGMWEMRGDPRHFTHSKVMAWVAFDRAVRSVEEFGLEGPLARWREIRDTIHQEVCERGFDRSQNCFVQSYGATVLDGSLLLIPIVGFLPPGDDRVRGTLTAIEKGLLRDGFVQRYHTSEAEDGLPEGEGVFLACSFWMVDNYILQGRAKEAEVLFNRLLSLRNDVGLLAEEYDPSAKRQLGNFPQAFSHMALVNTAQSLLSATGAAHQRSSGRQFE